MGALPSPLGVALVVLTLLPLASGSHFRYGALSWQPVIGAQRMYNGQAQQNVQVNLLAAYRRNYQWGANFGEQWKQTNAQNRVGAWYGSEVSRNVNLDPDNPGCDLASNDDAVRGACLGECPTRASDNIWDEGINRTKTGCVNTEPQYDAISTEDTNGNDIQGEEFFIRLPPRRQTNGDPIVVCPDPFYCDKWKADGSDNTAQHEACKLYKDNPSFGMERCASWHEVYGMFTGHDNIAVPVELQVTRSVETQLGPAFGNYIMAQGSFTHYYPMNTAAPFLAFFTGGDRVFECDGIEETDNTDDDGNCQDELKIMLNNNAQGRFRLEMNIWVLGDDNSSPRATMIPVIPLPRGTESKPITRFQVSAYDPDSEDELWFVLGNEDEMGGIVTSKSSVYPKGESNRETFVCDQSNVGPGNICPTDRTPQCPSGVTLPADSGVPGLVEWNTYETAPMCTSASCDPSTPTGGYPYCPAEGAECTKLRPGLYNFVIMIMDKASPTEEVYQGQPYKSKVPVDFMAYLYDGPMFYCKHDCRPDPTAEVVGNPTFASINGRYGEGDAACSVCGLGPAAASRTTNCTANANPASDCYGLASDGLSLVPPGDACVENRPPYFYQEAEKFGVYNNLDTPQVEIWTRIHREIVEADTSGVQLSSDFEYPQIQAFKGDAVQFYVTVVDDDECTDLTLEATHLPSSFNAVGVQNSIATFTDPSIANTGMQPGPDGVGTLLRKRFRWDAPVTGTDTRDDNTLVCFRAMDNYFATADPYYCVEIHLKEKPQANDQTLLRFSDRLALLWSPTLYRFVFADKMGLFTKYYTVCRYEDYMWHHAMVVIEENGEGRLFVDGEAMELMTPKDDADLSKGFDPRGIVFTTEQYPNKREDAKKRKRSRSLLAHEENLNDATDSPVDDMFADETEGIVPGEWCTFKIGMQCDYTGSTFVPNRVDEQGCSFKTFEGFIDEVAVWNRALRPAEVKETLFRMPQKASARTLAAPRGVQLDYTAGRVLYARFNNPCMESPQQAPPPPGSPPEATEGSGRRRLQQISQFELETNAQGVDRNETTLKWGPPPPYAPGINAGNAGRREYVADHAGFTAGIRGADGTLTVESFDPMYTIVRPYSLDLYALNTDPTVIREFPYDSKYAYTGVPWEAPLVTDVTTTEEGAPTLDAIPLDGVKIHVHGIGFARSVFSKCVLVQPDVAGDTELWPEFGYDNYVRSDRHTSTLSLNSFEISELSQVVKTPATAVYGQGNKVPYISNYDFHSPLTETQWDPSLLPYVPARDQKKVNAFQEDPNDSYSLDFFYGSWEIMECVAPAAAFPSNRYHLGVSNDAGLTMSPAHEVGEVTYMDYSLYLTGSSTSKFQAADEIRPLLGNTFTISFWVYAEAPPFEGFSKLLDLGGGNGIIYDGAIHGWLDSEAQTPAPNATAVNMWHHLAFVADGTTASFYYDMGETYGYGGASSSRKFSGFPAGGPTLLDFGAFGFRGYIDEVKMWSRAIGLEEFRSQHLAFARETESEPTNVTAYYRFNSLTAYMDDDGTVAEASTNLTEMLGTAVGGSYAKMAVPWEPSTMETMNGHDVKTKYDVFKQPVTGMGGDLQITGFNFADSFATGCFWGDEEPVKVPAFAPSFELQPYQCPAPVGDGEELDLNELDMENGDEAMVPEGTLGMPGGTSAAMYAYPAYSVRPRWLPSEATISNNGMTLSCAMDAPWMRAMDAPAFAMFSAGNMPTLTTYPFEFAEVALGCMGDNHLEADAVSTLAAGGHANSGYTFGAWVLPQSAASSGVGGGDGGGSAQRRLLATEGAKTMRRRLAGHLVLPEPQTVLAFEASDAAEHAGGTGHKALLMYDGEAFFYYDDCIQDVHQRSKAEANQWHFVMVSVDDAGEAILFIDGVVEEQFTTRCKPEADGLFSVGADYAYPGGVQEASAHFVGHVDEILVYQHSLTAEAMGQLMFSPTPTDDVTFQDIGGYDCASWAGNCSTASALYIAACPVVGVPAVAEDGSTCEVGGSIDGEGYYYSKAHMDEIREHCPVSCATVAYFPFRTHDELLPHGAVSSVGRSAFVTSSGPWFAATVVGVEPEVAGVAGGATVSVFGANIAPSPFLRVDFGGDRNVTADGYLAASGVAAKVPSIGQSGLTKPVAVHNAPPSAGVTLYDTEVVYTPTVMDLDVGLVSRVSFASTTISTALVDSATFMDIWGYDCASWAGDCSTASALYIAACPVAGVPAVAEDGSTCEVGGSINGEGYYYSKAHMDEIREHCPVSCDTGAATATAVDLASGEVAHTYPVANWNTADVHRAADKDLFNDAALVFDAEHPVTLATPSDAEAHTVCAWLFLLIAPGVPYAGAWKLVCVVADGSGAETVYLNAAPAAPTVAAFYAALFSDSTLGGEGSAEAGRLADVWVYDRALLPDEVAARYYTQEYALDLTLGSRTLLEAPFVTLPLKPGPLRFNLEMWVMPLSTTGMQTIASTDAAAQVLDSMNRDLGLHFGLLDNALTFSIHKGCSCHPCPALISMVSWKAKLLPGRWQHVSFIFPFGEGQTGEIAMALHVDGILRDMREFPGVVIPPVAEPVDLKLLLGQQSTLELNAHPFDGKIYDVRFSPSTAFAYQVKKAMQCPILAKRPEDVYYKLNEGDGAVANGGMAGNLVGLWTNSSYDDVTSPPSTTYYGEAAAEGDTPYQKVSDSAGRFVITARTACSKKRVHGGDAFTVKLMDSAGMDTDLPVEDTNDGNYHVTYEGFTCGAYTATVSLDGEELSTLAMDIVPGATDPTRTTIVGGMPTPSCFGVQTEFDIQARDAAGCIQSGHDDVFVMEFDGPHTMTATVTPRADDGLYRVTFTPEAPGSYHATLYMLGADGARVMIESGMYFCLDVCAEGSVQLGGDEGVLVEEDSTGQLHTALDLGFPGVTLELWFKLPQGGGLTELSRLVHKGGTAQQGNNTKSYELLLDYENRGFVATFYVGNGEYRSIVCSPQQVAAGWVESDWYHVAASYDGRRITIVLNGIVEGVADGDGAWMSAPKMVKPSAYYHPLELGANFRNGFIDEVKLWTVARTSEQIADAMYCAPYQQLDSVAAYFSFNEGASSTASGHGRECVHGGDSARVNECLQGQLLTDARFVADTPLTVKTTEGYYAPSAKYSVFRGAALTEYHAGVADEVYTVAARDKCNYVFTQQDSTAFAAVTQEMKVEYWSDTAAGEGSEFPILSRHGMASSPVYAVPPASRQCPGDPTPGPLRGDVFSGRLAVEGEQAPTTKAGMYQLNLTVFDGRMTHVSTPRMISVLAAAPDHFYVAPMDEGVAAGAPTTISVQVRDKHDNTVFVPLNDVAAHITLLATDSGATPAYTLGVEASSEGVHFDAASGVYTIPVTLGFPGTYSLVLTGGGANPGASTFEVHAAAWRKLLTDDLTVPTPTRRFEHTSAEYDGDVYIFGGVLYDRTYLNDMYVLQAEVGTPEAVLDGVPKRVMELAYKKDITFQYALAEESAVTLEVRVDTAELIAANRMNPSCLDVMFTLPHNGEALSFYLDPVMKDLPAGVSGACDSASTLYRVQLPAGSVYADRTEMTIEMYYGSPDLGIIRPNAYNDPHAVFHMYEGFEDASSSTFEDASTCTGEQPASSAWFHEYTTQLPFAGSRSMYVYPGATTFVRAVAAAPAPHYKLRAWFYDGGAENSAHFISPDLGLCEETAGGEPLLHSASAVGTYTLASTGKYCVASPWESTSHRSPGWHLFEMASSGGVMTVSIDDVVVKTDASTSPLTSLVLSAGFGVDGTSRPGLADNHAFWDEITVALVEPGVGEVTVAPMADDEPVAFTETRQWRKVDVANPPPPRYAHSAVVYDGKMVVFGGERSGYAFNDLWSYDFAEGEWSHVTPKSGHIPAPRYDHTAVVTAAGKMVVYGGRNSMRLLADMWALDLSTLEWTLLTESAAPGARFGHTAALAGADGDLFVFGGYGEAGFAGDFFRCDPTDGTCVDLTYGCELLEVPAAFLPPSLTARYQHSSTADARFVYVYGGASAAEPSGFGGVYKFAIDECSWEEVPSSTAPPMRRYEHAAGTLNGGFYVHGGHAGGEYFDDMYFFPLA